MNKRIRRIAGGVLILVLLLIVVGYIAGTAIYNSLTVIPPHCTAPYMAGREAYTPAAFEAIFEQGKRVVDATPYLMPEYETVLFPARDDPAITLEGWYVPAINVDNPIDYPVVIVVHGLRGCKKDPTVLLPAGMLTHNGFNVLMLDLRNHGNSTIEDGRTSVGIREHRDVLGAWDWLIAEKGFTADSIGVMGMSLGAGTTALAFGKEPRIAAVWLDSPYADMEVVAQTELARQGYPIQLAAFASLSGQLIAGIDLFSASPLDAMDAANNRPVFITHGKEDTRLTIEHTYALVERLEANGQTPETWLLDGLIHVEAVYAMPEEYARRLVGFFGTVLKQP
jgi:uncharacterized protein